MKKKIIKLLTINLILLFVVLESVLFFFNNLLSINTIFYMPNTPLKKDLLIKNKLRTDSKREISDNVIFEKNNLSRELSYPKKTIYRKPDIQDIKFKATDYFFYNNGFCNEDYEIGKKKYKMLAFGDSFTYCTFVKPNEAWIKKISFNDPIFKKINYGMTGTGLYEQIRLLNDLLDKDTKIIISAIYEGNDLRDIFKHLKYLTKKDEEVIIKKKDTKKNINSIKNILIKIFGKSYTFNYLAASKNIIFSKFSKKERFDFRFENSKSGLKYNVNNVDQDEVIIAKKIYNENITQQQVKNLFLEPIMKLNNLALQNNTFIIFIYIPSAHTSLGKNVIFNDKNVHLYLKKMSDVQREIFKDICNSYSLKCLDTTKALINANLLGKVTHFPSTVHLTSIGHKVIASTIDEFFDLNQSNF